MSNIIYYNCIKRQNYKNLENKARFIGRFDGILNNYKKVNNLEN